MQDLNKRGDEMTGISLYSISGRFFDLMARAAADDTLTPAELDEQYNELAELLQAKTPGVVAYYRNIDASLLAVDAEIKRLTELKARATKHRDNYRQYVKECMDRLGVIEISTDIGKLKIAKNPLSVKVDNLDAVPDDYIESTLTIKGPRSEIQLLLDMNAEEIEFFKLQASIEHAADKRKIADHFKATGEIINGVTFYTDSTRLDIK
jgi:Siphovirus Gp157